MESRVQGDPYFGLASVSRVGELGKEEVAVRATETLEASLHGHHGDPEDHFLNQTDSKMLLCPGEGSLQSFQKKRLDAPESLTFAVPGPPPRGKMQNRLSKTMCSCPRPEGGPKEAGILSWAPRGRRTCPRSPREGRECWPSPQP